MTSASDARQSLREAGRIVVKIGSRSLTTRGRFESLAQQIAAQRAKDRSVVLVSSGAIALGIGRLGLKARPDSIALLQAAAAAGQSHLMAAYEDAFEKHGLRAGQVLLTHDDLSDRERYLNARAALDALVQLKAIPIINENDVVSVDEIKFGDNDQLAAMVATLVGSEVLILLTDVEGVLDAHGNRVPLVTNVDEVTAFLKPSESNMSRGGMSSKIDAARRATHHGVAVVVANSSDDSAIARILDGEDVGTLFLPQGARLASRKHWIAYTLKPLGALLVDEGAVKAIKAGRSLLPAGVRGVRGDFDPGDAVEIVGPEGKSVARGLARYATRDVARLAGAKSQEIESRIGHYGGDEIVHRDDLVEVGT